MDAERNMKVRLSLALVTAFSLTAEMICGCTSSHPAIATATKEVSRPERGPATTVPACTAAKLGARFHGGGYGTGNDFGSIQIWNPSSAACQLHGSIGFSALYANGTPDPNARLNTRQPALSVTLPANMPRPAEQADPDAYLVAELLGAYRDDPTQPDALCRSQDEQTPATLVLSIGSLTLRTANLDPDTPATRGDSRSVYGCHGQVFLDKLTGPAAPQGDSQSTGRPGYNAARKEWLAEGDVNGSANQALPIAKAMADLMRGEHSDAGNTSAYPAMIAVLKNFASMPRGPRVA